jgi:TolB-like protein/Tfp pilus assembly protein PilF
MDRSNQAAASIYQFGPFRIDTADCVLLRDGKPVPVAPKAIDVLLALLAANGRVVDKEALMKKIWPDTFVEEANLAQNVSLLRKALSDPHEQQHYIETIPKRGYRFVGGAGDSKPEQTRPVARNSVAVLPFVDMSPNRDQEYISDGLTEELIHELANVDGLRVVARTSAFQFKGANLDVRTIGERLGVRAVLEGSVRKDGARLRITAQLNDATDGYHLWSEAYDREMKDVFALQAEIARAVAGTLRLKSAIQPRAADLESYHLYLKARYFRNKVTRDGYQKSISIYEQVIARTPDYAPAYAGLAESYCNVGWNYSMMPPAEAYPKALAAANQALALDDTLADAHVSLGLIKLNYEWDWPGAEQAFRRAIHLNPSHVNARHRYSHYLIAMGRIDESLAESIRSLELDPLDLTIGHHLGWHYRLARQYDKAISQLLKTLEMDPQQQMTHVYLGQTYLLKGMHAEAIDAFQRASELGRGTPDDLAWLAHAHAVSGNISLAAATLDQLKSQRDGSYVSAYLIAVIHAGLGETQEALKWLEHAYDERNAFMVYLKVEPDLDRLRSEPEFASLLTRMKLA